MFLSYVSEASPGCKYVLGARARASSAGGAGSAGATAARVARCGCAEGASACERCGWRGAGALQHNNTVASDLLHILSIITHSVQ